MKMHTTNYTHTLIAVADDCPVTSAVIPPIKEGVKTIANLQFELLTDRPYQMDSDDLLFHVYALRNNLKKQELREAREIFFSKGQPCLRTSPLTKRYGWGIHSNAAGKIALIASESPEYTRWINDETCTVVKAMRSVK